MFFHNLKYSLKTLFKNKTLIFWTFAFPIILGTLFYMAFSDIEESEKLELIPIAIIDNEPFKNNEIWNLAFQELSTPGENQLFETTYTSEENAKTMLENDEITGYFLLEDEPKIIVKESGINETILKYITEEISSSIIMTQNIIEYQISQINIEEIENSNETFTTIQAKITEMQNEEPNLKNTSNSNLSYTMIEYYTLIAMACLYGGLLATTAINQNLANMSSKGKRVSISPTNKRTLILSSVLASYITQILVVSLLFLFTIFVLKVDYGSNFPLIILLAGIGSLAGLSLGIFVSCLFKTNENIKTGIVLSITMLGCFLSGMMGITMKYVIDKNIPIINKLNPANMITDGFYSLYYYNTLDRYLWNLISLLLFSTILIGISAFFLRRQKYDSI